AVVVGDVTIEERASVWYNAVLRGDFNPIVVRRGANVQDCSVVHVTPRGGTEIGAGSTVGHNCTIHAASLGDECLIGNGATMLDFIGAYDALRRVAAMSIDAEVTHRIIGTDAEIVDESGLKLTPDSVYEDLAKFDLLYVAGGLGTVTLMDNRRAIDYLKTWG